MEETASRACWACEASLASRSLGNNATTRARLPTTPATPATEAHALIAALATAAWGSTSQAAATASARASPSPLQLRATAATASSFSRRASHLPWKAASKGGDTPLRANEASKSSPFSGEGSFFAGALIVTRLGGLPGGGGGPVSGGGGGGGAAPRALATAFFAFSGSFASTTELSTETARSTAAFLASPLAAEASLATAIAKRSECEESHASEGAHSVVRAFAQAEGPRAFFDVVMPSTRASVVSLGATCWKATTARRPRLCVAPRAFARPFWTTCGKAGASSGAATRATASSAASSTAPFVSLARCVVSVSASVASVTDSQASRRSCHLVAARASALIFALSSAVMFLRPLRPRAEIFCVGPFGAFFVSTARTAATRGEGRSLAY
mmetsp:Transcript_7050/g.18221  ORF Transcript_7050/g.18221 Transcript_7050/m.18221 type:complete len:387 (-) Transcript_7050:68-1228(-)